MVFVHNKKEDLLNVLLVFLQVKVLAYRAYEAAHPWTATKVVLADDHDDIWRVGETGRMDRLLEKYQCVLKNSIDTEAETEMNSNYWKFYNDIIHDEIKKTKEVDKCLLDGAKTFRQIFDKLIEG